MRDFWVCIVGFAGSWLLGSLSASSIRATYGIYGAIQSLDTPTTVTSLLQQCYAGFALNGCKDLNASAGFHKAYTFETQFTDPWLMNQQYCLQCCTNPVPRLGADETWNLSCPLNDVQRLSVSKGRRTYRFARRNALDDKTIIECPMPTRNLSTYLSGYKLELVVIERSLNFGAEFWRSVVECSVTITESEDPPDIFSEVLHLRSIPITQERPTAWVVPTVLAFLGTAGVMAIPIYKGKFRGQRCLHCGSWMVVINGMCLVCIIISCSIHPPPAKIYITNGKPFSHGVQQPDHTDTTDMGDVKPWQKYLHLAKAKLTKEPDSSTTTLA
ncbi:hypothetical protein F441_09706 [Phytophthora nicotianae CJ01A1]|uniref:Uncharacterized protein n=7 Tax=Phytophthora nicotianae TaxID=4792 RepID=V9F3S3_PHYNI|nr:hypothetical protein F443_09767 [Phytophthora nicotianae P1569]ETK85695.1 hypothetical protein L915_09572 [Phytophthora nicotianae]ETO74388.1 hypothetical protein F444_09864 [Phytophthora nicotianae P1976]ETP15569.1 hypothetical protein F441_09706 [Phytophthora nicotianae CJ01A1]ETP43632.1 hypothetical protein F442_09671 [Phytophthora nicotianae P10297]